MGTWWSKGSEIGVVLTTLGLAVACGGKYDIGSGETGGQGGDSGTGGSSTGGSSTDPEGGGPAMGGGPATGGGPAAGGDSSTSGGTAGSAGAPPTGGTSAGGSGSACPTAAGPLPDYVAAPPDVVWDRICRFLQGSTRGTFEPLPETTTVEWVRDRVDAVLAEQYVEDERAPGGLEHFFGDWAFGGEKIGAGKMSNAASWAKNFAAPAGNFSAFFAPVSDEAGAERVSFLSDRNFLTAYQTPTRRGAWMAQRLLCNGVLPPPEGIHDVQITVRPDQTTREATEEAMSAATCRGCHSLIQPLGYSLEHYDALGEYRSTENGLPIDSSGVYTGPGADWTFESIADLSTNLIGSCEAQTCFSSELLNYALANAYEDPNDAPVADEAELAYVTSEFRGHYLALAPLLRAIATTPAFLRE